MAKAAKARNPAVDAYIAKAKPFAQPILTRLRAVIHFAVPEVDEQIKWSMPFFVYRGIILGNMAAFKEHCSFGLWNENMAGLRQEGVEGRGTGMGGLGKLKSVEDLPPASELKAFLLEGVRKIEQGERIKSWVRPAAKKAAKPEAEVPEALATALKKNKVADKVFAGMSASCRREYCEWVGEAKREETREKRVATAVEWIADGKGRNWKYETC